MSCLICQSSTDQYLVTTVLHKYEVAYVKCRSCGFIATETPYWLDEAYSSAITSLDIGLPRRNIHWLPIVEAIIRQWYHEGNAFLDYGGGYGLFVRLMRDQGFNFFRQDTYCENLFAKHFDITDRTTLGNYELITAFEVFEHLPDPISSVEHMLSYGDSILFSTELQPNNNITPETWWYFITETGQHVSLYSKESLIQLSEHFKLNFYTDGKNMHLLTKKRIPKSGFKLLVNPFFAKFYNKFGPGKRRTLLNTDFNLMVEKSHVIH